ncbi:MAG: hypothetical protein AVDCRST_MAG51-2121, partial [uncultured Ramlibacter sp.]
ERRAAAAPGAAAAPVALDRADSARGPCRRRPAAGGFPRPALALDPGAGRGGPVRGVRGAGQLHRVRAHPF